MCVCRRMCSWVQSFEDADLISKLSPSVEHTFAQWVGWVMATEHVKHFQRKFSWFDKVLIVHRCVTYSLLIFHDMRLITFNLDSKLKMTATRSSNKPSLAGAPQQFIHAKINFELQCWNLGILRSPHNSGIIIIQVLTSVTSSAH